VANSFYWHDYETFGADPQRDRPVQFAGVRTNEQLEVIEDPLVLFCQPADDCLPNPEACLITGITPQQAVAEGIPEYQFIQQINDKFSVPGTCGAGYNSIRFDDEVTRNCLYRNFHDPYAREWQNSNSRWDLIDLVRAVYALRPEGIQWPKREDGAPSFRLEDLTSANGISHQAAHDALSDVHATIAVAALIKRQQPKLYDYLFQLRSKHKVAKLVNYLTPKPLLHVSGMYPATQGCLGLVAPVVAHPVNSNGVIVWDLSVDPVDLGKLSVEEIQHRLFTSRAILEQEGLERLPLKTVHMNKCPVLAPVSALTDSQAEKFALDRERCRNNFIALMENKDIPGKVMQAFSKQEYDALTDPDLMIYSGGFFSKSDKSAMEEVHRTEPQDLVNLETSFVDERLAEMLFRYRARNFPESLDYDDEARWRQFCADKVMRDHPASSLSWPQFESLITELKHKNQADPARLKLLDDVYRYSQELVQRVS